MSCHKRIKRTGIHPYLRNFAQAQIRKEKEALETFIIKQERMEISWIMYSIQEFEDRTI